MNVQEELDMPHVCRECGERGRAKKVMSVRGELRLYCHDDERSCFNDAIVRLSA